MSDNKKFGEWCSLNFSGLPQQTANNLINLARFFDDSDRPLGNIPVSAGYLISSPKNEKIAEQAYERSVSIENPTLEAVKDIINELSPREKKGKTSNDFGNLMLKVNKLSHENIKLLLDQLITKLNNDERNDLAVKLGIKVN